MLSLSWGMLRGAWEGEKRKPFADAEPPESCVSPAALVFVFVFVFFS